MVEPRVYKINKMERIYFATPFVEAVMAEVERLGANSVFVMCSGTLNRETDKIESLKKALGNRFLGLFDRCKSHTPRDNVMEALEIVRAAGECDLFIAVGGGAVVDTAKMVGLCLANGVKTMADMDPLRDTVDEQGRRHSPKKTPPKARMIAVPSTLSGGDIGQNIGCTDPARNVKEGYGHPLLMPIAVVYDPSLAALTPPRLWLATGIKALDHAVEVICTKKPDPMCTEMALIAARLLAENLPKSKADPNDLEARNSCQQAIWLARSSRSLTGVNFGASHGFGHTLGGGYGIPHGETSCVVLPSVMRYNAAVTVDAQARISAAMGRPGDAAGDVIEGLIKALNLPYRLRAVGIDKADFHDIAEHSLHTGTVKANPRPIKGVDDLIEILEMAW
ncbi:MAG: iron-containing alcohol dehydrogenase [Alphaproteobacteria bacterium]